MPFRHPAPPGNKSMLIVLVVFAVIISLVAEMAYGYLQDRYELSWVRPAVREHHAIMRVAGRMR